MDLMRKKDILALPELPDQRTQISAVRQSAATVQDSATPLRGWVCHLCAHFNTPEEEEVVFVKSWFEETKKLAPEPGQGEERLLVYEETKDKKSEEREVDDGDGAFIVVDRKRARPKKKVQNEGVDDGDNVRFTEVGQKKARQKKKIPDNLLATGGIPQYALRRPGRPTR
ncbi:unnamed protein product [Alternaria alternata]